MKKDNNGITTSSLREVEKKTGVWSHSNRNKTEIAANKEDKTSDRPARYTDIVFALNITGALLPIE